jgi:integral membrane sensor domain MASE1
MVTPNHVLQDDSLFEFCRIAGQKLGRHLAPDNLLMVAAIAMSYFFTARFGLQVASPNAMVTAFWLPSGISLAALLLKGNRVLPGIFLGSFLVIFTGHGSWMASLGTAAGSCAAAMIGVSLVNRYAHGTKAFYKAWDTFRFVVFAGLLPTMFSATIGVYLLCRDGSASWSDFSLIWPVWWIGDSVGVILLAPFLVLLFSHTHHCLSISEIFEATLLLAGLSFAALMNFGPPVFSWVPRTGLLFLCAPFLFWAAYRFCPLEAAGSMLVVAGFAMWGSLHGYGPYGNTTSAPLFVAGYVIVASATTMIGAAIRFQMKEQAEIALGWYFAHLQTKDNEILELRETVASLEVEIADKRLCGMDRISGRNGG